MTIINKRLQLMAGIILFIHCLFLLWAYFLTQQLYYQNILIMIAAGGLIHVSNKLKSFPLYFAHMIIFLLLMWFNYDFIGAINKVYAFPLKDFFFFEFDQWLFSMPTADWIYQIWEGKGIDFIPYFYDVLMIAYVIYYIMPYIVILLLFFNEQREEKEIFLSIYTLSAVFFLLFSYFLYVLVPVTGPQYYWPLYRGHLLPFTSLGHFIHGLIYDLHPNWIDCFPSIHTGMSVLATWGMFHLRSRGRWPFLILTCLIIIATLALRYHYLLDVIAGLLLILMTIWGSKKIFC